jgi:hypothetical protein
LQLTLTELPATGARNPLVMTLPFSLPVSGLEVSILQGSLHSAHGWEMSVAVTDPGDERLFKNPTDLFAMNGSLLRQVPSRHWWFSVRRSF